VPTSPVTVREAARAKVIAAARKCFREHGVQNTSMQDIADAAGTSRRLLYRSFAGREELVEEAVIARMRELAQAVPNKLEDYGSFAEALIEMSLIMIENGRADPEQSSLFVAMSQEQLHLLSAGRHAPVAGLVLDVWRPWLSVARVTGELREGITDEQAVEWLRGVYLLMALRTDMTPDDERQMLTRFVLPSLVHDGSATAPRAKRKK
jgi:AcrR family transcriptional regulator